MPKKQLEEAKDINHADHLTPELRKDIEGLFRRGLPASFNVRHIQDIRFEENARDQLNALFANYKNRDNILTDLKSMNHRDNNQLEHTGTIRNTPPTDPVLEQTANAIYGLMQYHRLLAEADTRVPRATAVIEVMNKPSIKKAIIQAWSAPEFKSAPTPPANLDTLFDLLAPVTTAQQAREAFGQFFLGKPNELNDAFETHAELRAQAIAQRTPAATATYDAFIATLAPDLPRGVWGFPQLRDILQTGAIRTAVIEWLAAGNTLPVNLLDDLQNALATASTPQEVRTALTNRRFGLSNDLLIGAGLIDTEEAIKKVRGEAVRACLINRAPKHLKDILTAYPARIEEKFETLALPMPTVKEFQTALAAADSAAAVRDVFEKKAGILPAETQLILGDALDLPRQVRSEAAMALLPFIPDLGAAPKLKSVIDEALPAAHGAMVDHFKNLANPFPKVENIQAALATTSDIASMRTVLNTHLGIPDATLQANGFPDSKHPVMEHPLRGEAVVKASLPDLANSADAKASPRLQAILQNHAYDDGVARHFSTFGRNLPTIPNLQRDIGQAPGPGFDGIRRIFANQLGIPGDGKPALDDATLGALRTESLKPVFLTMISGLAPTSHLRTLLLGAALPNRALIDAKIDEHLTKAGNHFPTLLELETDLAAATTPATIRKVFLDRLGIPADVLTGGAPGGVAANAGPLADGPPPSALLGQLHAEAAVARFAEPAATPKGRQLTAAFNGIKAQVTTAFKNFEAKRGGYPANPRVIDLEQKLAASTTEAGVRAVFTDAFGVTDPDLIANGLEDGNILINRVRGEAALRHLQTQTQVNAPALHRAISHAQFSPEVEARFRTLANPVRNIKDIQNEIAGKRTPDEVRKVLQDQLGILTATMTDAANAGADLNGALGATELGRIYGEARHAHLEALVPAAAPAITPSSPVPPSGKLNDALTRLKGLGNPTADAIKTFLADAKNVIPPLDQPAGPTAPIQAQFAAAATTPNRKNVFTTLFGVPAASVNDDEADGVYAESKFGHFLSTTYQQLAIRPTALNTLMSNAKVQEAIFKVLLVPGKTVPNLDQLQALLATLATIDLTSVDGARNAIINTFYPVDPAAPRNATLTTELEVEIDKHLAAGNNKQNLFAVAQVEKNRNDARELETKGIYNKITDPATRAAMVDIGGVVTFSRVVSKEPLSEKLRDHFATLTTTLQAQKAMNDFKGLNPEVQGAYRRWKEEQTPANRQAYREALNRSMGSVVLGSATDQVALIKQFNEREHDRRYYISLIENKAVAQAFVEAGVYLKKFESALADDPRKGIIIILHIQTFNESMRKSPNNVNDHLLILINALKTVTGVDPTFPGVAAGTAALAALPPALQFDDPSIAAVKTAQHNVNRAYRYFSKSMEEAFEKAPDTEASISVSRAGVTITEQRTANDDTREHNKIFRDLLISQKYELNTTDPDFNKNMVALNTLDWTKTDLATVNTLLSNVLIGKPKQALSIEDFHYIKAIRLALSTSTATTDQGISRIQTYATALDKKHSKLSSDIKDAIQSTAGFASNAKARDQLKHADEIHDLSASEVNETVEELKAHKAHLDALAKLYALVREKKYRGDYLTGKTATFDETATRKEVENKFPHASGPAREALIEQLETLHAQKFPECHKQISERLTQFTQLQENLATLKAQTTRAHSLPTKDRVVAYTGKTTLVQLDAKNNVKDETTVTGAPKTKDQKIQEMLTAAGAVAGTGITVSTSTGNLEKLPGVDSATKEPILSFTTVNGGSPATTSVLVGEIKDGKPQIEAHLTDELKNVAAFIQKQVIANDPDNKFIALIKGDQTAFFERFYEFARNFRPKPFGPDCCKEFLKSEVANYKLPSGASGLDPSILNPTSMLSIKDSASTAAAKLLANAMNKYVTDNKTFLKQLAIAAIEQQRTFLQESKIPFHPGYSPTIEITNTWIPAVAEYMMRYCEVQGYDYVSNAWGLPRPTQSEIEASKKDRDLNRTLKTTPAVKNLASVVKETKKTVDEIHTATSRAPSLRRGSGDDD